MSAYKVFENVQFASGELLIKALQELGYHPEIGQELTLYGYQGDARAQKAQIVVRRREIGRLSNDLGFQWNGRAFVPIISEYDAGGPLGQEWQEKLSRTYDRLAVLKFLQAKKGQVQYLKHGDDGALFMRATVEVEVQL